MEVYPNCSILPFTSSYLPLHESGLHWTKYWLLAELLDLKTGYGFVALVWIQWKERIYPRLCAPVK